MYLMMSSNVGGEGLVRLTRMRQVSMITRLNATRLNTTLGLT